MNPQQIANSNSSLYRWLESHKATSPFQYSLRKNVPPYARLEQSTVQEQNVLTGSELRFTVPPFGVLRSIRLRMKVNSTHTGTVDVQEYGPVNFLRRIELRSRDKSLATTYPQAIIDWIKTHLSTKQASVLNGEDFYSQNTTTIAIGGSREFEILLPFSFTEKLKQHLDTRATEPLQLVIRTADTFFPALIQLPGVESEITIPVMTARFDYYVPGAAEQRMLNNELTRDRSGLGVAKLQYSWYREPAARVLKPLDKGLETSVRLHCPFPIVKTMVIIRDVSGTGRYRSASFLQVSSLALSDGGVVITALSGDQIQLMNAMPPFDVTEQDRRAVLWWAMSPDVTEQTGFLSLKNHANPVLSVTTPDLAAPEASYDVEVYHQYLQAVSVSPNDGTIINRTLS